MTSNTTAVTARGTTRIQAATAVAVPVTLAFLLGLHPLLSYDPLVLEDRLGRWFLVHFGLLFALPALTAVAWSTLRGVEGPLGVVGRGALLVFLAFASAYDAMAGIGTGWLLQYLNELGPEAREGAEILLRHWWVALNPHWIAAIGQVAWGVFAFCAVIVHRRAGSHALVHGGLAVGGLYALAHGSIPATVTLLAFAAAVWRLHWPTGRVDPRR